MDAELRTYERSMGLFIEGVGPDQLLFRYTIKGGDNSRSTHEASFVLDLSSQPTFKGTLCFLQPLDLRTEVYFDSINVDTAVADYVSSSGSIKRVGRCLCFHQACTPGVCEAFLVVCGSDHLLMSDPL
jgi:hypothetical protein